MEIEFILKNILLIVLIIAIIIVVIQIISVVNRVNKVLDNVKVVSNGIAEFTVTPLSIKENVSDLAGMTVDKVVGKQVERVKSNLTQNLVQGVMKFIQERRR